MTKLVLGLSWKACAIGVAMSGAIVACTSSETCLSDVKTPTSSDSPALLSAPTLFPVQFKEGRPLSGYGIEASLHSPTNEIFDVLQYDLEIIEALPHIRFEVLGFTDDAECAGIECTTLSLRRATLVRNWLLSRGVSGNQLAEPIGHGSNMPIDDNSSDSGRSRNRRVEINILP